MTSPWTWANRESAKCRAEGCSEDADPRWWMHARSGRRVPACDGHGCLARSEAECECKVSAAGAESED